MIRMHFFIKVATGILMMLLVPMQILASEDNCSWVEETMAQMTLEEKVGQMFIAPARGYFPGSSGRALRDGSRNTFEEFEHNLVNNHVGGFRLYGGEVVQTAVLINRLQSMSKVPLFFSSDVEAGLGREFQDQL